MARTTGLSPAVAFPTDGPLEPSEMIGRRDELRALVSSVRQGAHQVLVGPRRTGKTTLCRSALSAFRNAGVYVASVDLFALTSVEELADAITSELISNRPTVRRSIRQVAERGRQAAGLWSLAPVVRLRTEIGADLEVALLPKAERPRLADESPLRSALLLLQRMADIDGVRVVLHLDEVQELAHRTKPFGDPDRVTKLMRSVLQGSPAVTTIFSGSQEHMMRDLLAPRNRAFHGWGAWVALAHIPEHEWLAGLPKRFARAGMPATPTAVERLLRLSEAHPRSTMLLAQQSCIAAALDRAPGVDEGAVETGLYRAMAADFGLHEQVVVELKGMGRHVLTVARRLADQSAPYGLVNDGVSPSSVQRALDDLLRAGLVEKDGCPGRGGWRIVDPYLRRFLRTRAYG